MLAEEAKVHADENADEQQQPEEPVIQPSEHKAIQIFRLVKRDAGGMEILHRFVPSSCPEQMSMTNPFPTEYRPNSATCDTYNALLFPSFGLLPVSLAPALFCLV